MCHQIYNEISPMLQSNKKVFIRNIHWYCYCLWWSDVNIFLSCLQSCEYIILGHFEEIRQFSKNKHITQQFRGKTKLIGIMCTNQIYSTHQHITENPTTEQYKYTVHHSPFQPYVSINWGRLIFIQTCSQLFSKFNFH